jgi:hypothetical protein
MALRTVVWSILVMCFGAALAVSDMPDTKPAAKEKPAAKATGTHYSRKFNPPPKPLVSAAQALPADRIPQALNQPIDIEFIETQLCDAADAIAEHARIPVRVDPRALDDVGVQTDVPVTIKIRGVKLRSALTLILRQLDLTWTVRNDVLLITTPEAAEGMLETRVYEVADLATARDEQLRPYNDFDQLIHVITSTVKPTTWDTVGGVGSIAGFEAAGIAVLAVSGTREQHEGVETLLADLRKAKRGGADAGQPIRERPRPASKASAPRIGAEAFTP